MTIAGRQWRSSARAVVLVALLAPTVPLVVALLARRHPPWVPDLDLALTELRVRDVGGPHSPLLGLPGRFGTLSRQGSHPGPISFYLLAPAYRLFGSSSFALQSATVLFHLVGAWTAVGLVARRAGERWALATGVGLAVLVAGLGPNLFTEPWNPHLPLMWWVAFLAAVWCGLMGDAAALPVLVIAGSVCAQTHVSYLAAVAVLTCLAAFASLRWPERAWVAHPARWLAAAAVLGLVLWLPPALDQIRHDPGNATLLREHLLDPPEPAVGFVGGGRLVLERLDLVHLARSMFVDPGRLNEGYPTGASAPRGAVLVALWAVAAGIGLRRATRAQRSLHALAAGALLLAVVSAARIVGYPWSYLLLWVWSVALLLVLGIVSAVSIARVRRVGLVAVGLLAVVVAIRASVTGSDAASANPVLSRAVTEIAPVVAAALDSDHRYLITWTDAVNLGGFGYGMVDELERRGVDVAVRADLGTQFGSHRTVTARPADAQLVVATGTAIERWSVVAGVRELVHLDARTLSERAEARRVRAALILELRGAGLTDLVPVVDENLYGVAFDHRLTARAQVLVGRLGALGAPVAVYLAPVGTELP